MPTDAPTAPASSDDARRGGDTLIEAAADGQPLTVGEAGDLLDYYLTNRGLPGTGKTKPLLVTLGFGADARDFACTVHTVEWSAWQDSIDRATNKTTGEFDRYVAASWCVARALVKPTLGPTVAAMQQEAKNGPDGKIDDPEGTGERISPPTDAAHLLRRIFAKQSGALLELNAEVLKISRLANDQQSVREVEAAKN